MPTPDVLAGIRRFQEHFRENRESLGRLATEGQAPEVLFIACSDSRVSPELITGAAVGDLYVARTIGNVVPPYGSGQMGMGAVVEYAVLHLRVKHVVLCGHTDCGGIRALDTPPDWSRASHIARWIEYARRAKTKVDAEGLPPEECHLAMVRENVLLQLENLRTYDPVHEGEGRGSLTVHGWVYHVETCDFEAYDEATGTWSPLEPKPENNATL